METLRSLYNDSDSVSGSQGAGGATPGLSASCAAELHSAPATPQRRRASQGTSLHGSPTPSRKRRTAEGTTRAASTPAEAGDAPTASPPKRRGGSVAGSQQLSPSPSASASQPMELSTQEPQQLTAQLAGAANTPSQQPQSSQAAQQAVSHPASQATSSAEPGCTPPKSPTRPEAPTLSLSQSQNIGPKATLDTTIDADEALPAASQRSLHGSATTPAASANLITQVPKTTLPADPTTGSQLNDSQISASQISSEMPPGQIPPGPATQQSLASDVVVSQGTDIAALAAAVAAHASGEPRANETLAQEHDDGDATDSQLASLVSRSADHRFGAAMTLSQPLSDADMDVDAFSDTESVQIVGTVASRAPRHRNEFASQFSSIGEADETASSRMGRSASFAESQELMSQSSLAGDFDESGLSATPNMTSQLPSQSAPDALANALGAIASAAAHANNQYLQLRRSWDAERSQLEVKLRHSESQLQQSQSLVHSFKTQLAALEAKTATQAGLEEHLTQQASHVGDSQLSRDALAAKIRILSAQCADLRENMAKTRDELATFSATAHSLAQGALGAVVAKYSAMHAESERVFGAALQSLSDQLAENQDELARALAQLAESAEARDQAVQSLGEARRLLDAANAELADLDARRLSQIAKLQSERSDMEALLKDMQREIGEDKNRIDELQRRLLDLALAADAAEGRARVADEQHLAQSSEHLATADALTSIQAEMLAAKGALAEHQTQLERARAELASVSEQSTAAVAAWAAKETELHGRISDLATKQLASEEHASSLEAKLVDATDQLRALSAELSKALEAASSWEAKFNEASDALNQATVSRAAEAGVAGTLSADLAELHAKYDAVCVELDKQKQTSAEIVAASEERIGVLQVRASELEAERSAITSELAAGKEALAALETTLADSQAQIQQLVSAQQELVQSLAGSDAAKKQLEEVMGDKDNEIKRLKDAANAAAERLEQLEEQIRLQQSQISRDEETARQVAQHCAHLETSLTDVKQQREELDQQFKDVMEQLETSKKQKSMVVEEYETRLAELAAEHAQAKQAADARAEEQQQLAAQLRNQLDDAMAAQAQLNERLLELMESSALRTAAHEHRISELEDDLAVQQSKNSGLQSMIDDVNQALAAKDSQVARFEAMIAEQQAALEGLKAHEQELLKQASLHKAEAEALERANDDLRVQCDASTANIVQIKAELEQSASLLTSARDELAGREQQTAAFEAQIGALEARVATLTADLKTAEEAGSVRASEAAKLQAAVADAQRAASSAEAQCAQLNAALEERTTARAELETQLRQSRDQIQGLEEKLAKAEERAAEHARVTEQQQAEHATQLSQMRAQNREAVANNIKLKKEVEFLQRKLTEFQTLELSRKFTSKSANGPAPSAAAAPSTQEQNSDRDVVLTGASVWDARSNAPSEPSSSQDPALRQKRAAQPGHVKPDVTPALKRVRSDLASGLAVNSTPGSVRRVRQANAKILICFSGFKDGTPFHNALKKELAQAIKTLPDAAVLTGSTANYDPRITHMIAPPGSRTLKTFAASLMSAWLINDPRWVLDSAKHGSWLDESKYGFRFLENPIRDKRFFLAPSFMACPKTKEFRLEYLRCLVLECSRGHLVDKIGDADYVIRADGDQTEHGSVPNLDWNGFIALIPHQPHA
ncbi:hypothetical protein HK105_207487 [Polyrhizophydium stewartii]|uniref:BRCT domain-containing protein n=1 Tax=Polyrhizophydium stewartii TaxID=2732419 RepID=A0ABR4N0H4_9FUNG